MKSIPKILLVIDGISALFFLTATLMVFAYAPLEAEMGAVQKVFYFHVAAGWLGMLGYACAVIAGIIYLIRKTEIWDIVG